MSQIKTVSQIDDDEIDIGQIIHTLWHSKWLIIIMAIITGGFGVVYAIMATPIYSGNALLQIETKSGGFEGMLGLPDALGGGGSETSTELELLKSRKVVVPTIDKFNLEIIAKPLTYPIIGNYFRRVYSGSERFAKPLFGDYFDFMKSYAWGGERIIVNQFNVPEDLYKKEFFIIYLGDDKYSLILHDEKIFDGEVGVQHHIDDFNIDIQVGDLKGRIGTYFTLTRLDRILVIEDLVKNLLVSEKGMKSGIVNISMMGADKDKIVKVIDHILSTYQYQNVEYNSTEAEKSIVFVEAQLPEVISNMEKAEQDMYDYRLKNKTVDLEIKTEQLLQQLLQIEESLNELNLIEHEIKRKFKKSHPTYIDFYRKKNDLEKKKADVNSQAAHIPTEQFNVFKLQRDVELNEKLYLQMLNRYEELKIIKASTLGSIRIIDRTVVYPKAVKPKKVIIAVVSIFVGVLLAIGYILIRAMLNKGIESIDQLEEIGYNVYASIPLSPLEEKLAKMKPRRGEERILSKLHPEELAVEAMRSLRTSLHFAMMEADNNIIMITGPSPGIGKSFISQNLAALIAQSGSKILLVDIDFRRGRVHESFGLDVEPGLSDYLSGVKEFDEVCFKTKIENLDVVTRGKNPPNPSELLMGKKFTEFCEIYKDKYDFIILDTPPILAVTDASIVGKFAGTSMMVVKQGVNHLREIEIATTKLALTGVDIKGYIFNGISKKSAKGGNDHYHYEYT